MFKHFKSCDDLINYCKSLIDDEKPNSIEKVLRQNLRLVIPNFERIQKEVTSYARDKYSPFDCEL